MHKRKQIVSQQEDNDVNCSICFGPLFDNKNDVITLPCSALEKRHEFHFKCLHQWSNQEAQKNKLSCPLCRTSLKSKKKQGKRLYDHAVPSEPEKEKKAGCFGEIIPFLIAFYEREDDNYRD